MSDSNGAFKIGGKGWAEIELGETGVKWRIDVVDAFNTWTGLMDEFRTADGKMERGKIAEINRVNRTFMASMILGSAEALLKDDPEKLQKVQVFVAQLSLADVLNFIKWLAVKMKELRHFFEDDGDSGPSSRPSLDVTFSE